MIFDGDDKIGLYPKLRTSLIPVSYKYVLIIKSFSNKLIGLFELVTDDLPSAKGKAPEFINIKRISWDLFPHKVHNISSGDKVISVLLIESISKKFGSSSALVFGKILQSI